MGSSRTWPRRLIAAATSLALVGAGLITLAHHVETRHEICAEHGELMHVGGNGVAVAELADSISDDPLDLDHDEHCAIAWSTSKLVEPGAACQHAIIAGGPEPAIAPSGVDDLGPAALFRLAPKTSPPA